MRDATRVQEIEDELDRLFLLCRDGLRTGARSQRTRTAGSPNPARS